MADDFLDDNFLSNDCRVPVTLLQTNACAPLATNAIAGNIWDNFSSASYKDLPSVGAITVYDPFTGEPQQYHDAGRRARLHARAVAGQRVVHGAVPAEQQRRPLRPEPFGRGPHGCPSKARSPRCCGRRSGRRIPLLGDKIPGVIDRTTATSWLRIPTGYLPDVIKESREVLQLLAPVFDQGGIEIGPIPAGTPVDLLANFDPLPPTTSLRERLPTIKRW